MYPFNCSMSGAVPLSSTVSSVVLSACASVSYVHGCDIAKVFSTVRKVNDSVLSERYYFNGQLVSFQARKDAANFSPVAFLLSSQTLTLFGGRHP